jgi:hypothetical protein
MLSIDKHLNIATFILQFTKINFLYLCVYGLFNNTFKKLKVYSTEWSTVCE